MDHPTTGLRAGTVGSRALLIYVALEIDSGEGGSHMRLLDINEADDNLLVAEGLLELDILDVKTILDVDLDSILDIIQLALLDGSAIISAASHHHSDAQKIALPFSDTPLINRDMDFPEQDGSSQRRSSLGMRGRRASSLIENGHSAIPHSEVDAAEVYKHIEEGKSLWRNGHALGGLLNHPN
ncbi:hypothetical protein CONLIGDRAFT_718698 [Coniochaeta ligniaria NRRL 30616]|uniref:Uncharacterized protein n=1 Tax=Coniochaeta ligniaria NRRL 30616 TaxID=1408157 RepID=A0A1J7I9C6_9PEZI|nr:hypothetical protein CONLIGDRAFT_718698 [Coniochaeta ligniaria NRRL 30616]